MKKILFILMLLFAMTVHGQTVQPKIADTTTYLSDLKSELKIEWPKNRTINLVFHGHSVPSGYFKTPEVNTLDAYPYLLLKKLKEHYPFAVINIITTAVGGENSVQGARRFKKDVLIHKPDVLFIDYALYDLGVGLEASYKAWNKMIRLAKKQNIKVILLTPSPDQRINYSSADNELKKYSDQIIRLARENQVGVADSYRAFEFLYPDKGMLSKYMAQVNHPNELGHGLIADEIMKWFK